MLYFNMNRVLLTKYGAFISFLFVLPSCYHNRSYEKNITIKGYEWNSNFTPSFTVEIKDTSVLYNLSVNIRHTEAYPFQNIWLMVGTRQPDSTRSSRRFDVLLVTDACKWFGERAGDIWDYGIS